MQANGAGLPFVDLDATVKPVAKVKLFGKMRLIMPVSGRVFDLAQKMKAAKDGDGPEVEPLELFAELRAAAAESVVDPALTENEVGRLSMEMVAMIGTLSRGAVDQVEAAIRKNGTRSARRATEKGSRSK